MSSNLFSDKNQAYGAFFLRRIHKNVLSWSALVTLIVFIVIMLLLMWYYNRPGKHDSSLWYFYDGNANGQLIKPPKNNPPPPAGGMVLPELPPIVTDSVAEMDTLRNPANSNGNDTTGNGNGNGDGTGDGILYYNAQQPPAFPGGETARKRFLQQNINYPPEARDKKIKGSVYISFVVEKDGSITHIKLLKGIGYGCDEEAMRVVNSMPRWIPGRQNGVPVRVQLALPLSFTLN